MIETLEEARAVTIRPRERIYNVGVGVMSDAELLALLLGAGTQGHQSLHTAQQLLARFDGVGGLARAHITDLRNESGIGTARAAVLSSALELGRRSLGPRAERPRLRLAEDVDRHYRPLLVHLQSEAFHVACLDVRNRLIRDERVAQGGFTSCAVLPREIFAPALREGAVAIILIHNHPSGETEPSSEDLELTRRVEQAGQVLGIKVLDHVIVGTSGFTSLKGRGHL